MTPKTTGDLKTIRYKLQMIMNELNEIQQQEEGIDLTEAIGHLHEADTKIYNVLPKTDE